MVKACNIIKLLIAESSLFSSFKKRIDFMKSIYFDNGATSFPKAPGVSDAMCKYINEIGSSVNRGIYDKSLQAERIILDTREMLCDLFNFDKTDNVVFTKNVTESINVILKGFLKKDSHVIVTSMEHNAVMRPLNSLQDIGVSYTCISSDQDGNLNYDELESSIQENTKLIFTIHSSNVSGTINDINRIGQIAKDNNIFFAVDAAQTAGIIDIDMKSSNIDALCFTGHKGLLGPQGMGGFLISDDFNKEITPFIEGGTGSKSDLEIQPMNMPDKFESGTPNVVGIYGLHASLQYLKETGIENIHKKEIDLVEYLLEKIEIFEDEIRVIAKNNKNRTGVVSLDFKNQDNATISYVLSSKYQISNRVGMHCAPSAHKTFGTFPQGSVRVSFSYFNTFEEVDVLINALSEILKS
jgi:cysteine desulfurase family protein